MTASSTKGPPVTVGGVEVRPGQRRTIELPVARLPTGTHLSLPVMVVNGRGDGPMVWLSGAVHGDELNGIEIVRRVIKRLDPRTLRGSVIAAPIVNVFGFVNGSRYLPDRRDLNRSFPGSPRGSLAARLAHLFMEQIAIPCAYGIDFHTGTNHRTNLPQIRANLGDAETRRVAEAFGAPIMIDAKTRDGSLREVTSRDGTIVLLYEAGEAQRFSLPAIEAGVDGALRVFDALAMRDATDVPAAGPSVESNSTTWVRARRSGILWLEVGLGDRVARGDVVGTIADAFGDDQVKLRAPVGGIVIGHTRNPLASQGDGIVHIAEPV